MQNKIKKFKHLKIFHFLLSVFIFLQFSQIGAVSVAFAEALELKEVEIEEAVQVEESQGMVPREVIVKFKEASIDVDSFTGQVQVETFALVNDLDVEDEDVIDEANAATFTIESTETVEEVIEELEQSSVVEYVQPNYQYEPKFITNDTLISDLWALDASHDPSFLGIQASAASDMDVEAAWNKFSLDEEVIVAVIDSGVQYEHEDLENMMWDGSGQNACNDDEGNPIFSGCPNHGWYHNGNSSSDDPKPVNGDQNLGHGTHVAGIIAAEQSNGLGVAGIAKGVKIMALKSSLSTSDIVKGIQFAENNGATLINASWGDPFVNGEYVHLALDQALYEAIRDFDGLFIAAAGNDSQNHDSGDFGDVMFPAGFSTDTTVDGVVWPGLDNIISVAAINPDNAFAGYSDYGNESVHVGAPGTRIQSTYYNGGTNEYSFLDGTSMAAPYVTGLAGMLSAYDSTIPLWSDNGSDFTIKNIILNNGDNLTALADRTTTGKRPNANNSIIAIDDAELATQKALLLFDDIKGENTVESDVSSNLSLPTTGDKNVTISWNSSAPDTISNTGVVTIPAIGEDDVSVTLTATLSKNASVSSKDFTLTVQALVQNDADAVAADKAALTFDSIKGTNTDESNVISNLSLPTVGANGSTITWASNNEVVLATDGVVTRPAFNTGNADVILTATLTKNAEVDAVAFNLTVLEHDPSDAESVATAKTALTFDSFKAGNDAEDNIMADLILPTIGDNDVLVTWASSDEAVITTAGVVTRPTFDAGDAVITLTATLTKNAETDTKVFTLTVIKMPQTDAESVAVDKAALVFAQFQGVNTAEDSITLSMTMPTLGSSGSTITWASDNEAVIATDGTVTRPTFDTGDAVVTLTATFTKNADTDTKAFTFTVLKEDPTDLQAVAAAEGDLVFDSIKQENTELNAISSDLDLITSSLYETTINWASSDEAVVSIAGVVARPSSAQGNTEVTLTATISKGVEQTIKVFTVTVIAADQTDEESVVLDKAALTFDVIQGTNTAEDNIAYNLSLPTSGANGTVITWVSSNTTVVSNTGEVTIPAGVNADVDLTATITKNEASDTVVFNLTVIATQTGIIQEDGTDVSTITDTSEVIIRDTVTDVIQNVPVLDEIKDLVPSIQDAVTATADVVIAKKDVQVASASTLDTSATEFDALTADQKTAFETVAAQTSVVIQPLVILPQDTSESSAANTVVSVPSLTVIKASDGSDIRQVDVSPPVLKTDEEQTTIQSAIVAPANSSVSIKNALEVATNASEGIRFEDYEGNIKYIDICMEGSISSFDVSSASEVIIYSSTDNTTWTQESSDIQNKQFVGVDLFCFQTSHFTSFAATTVTVTQSSSSGGGGGGGGGGFSGPDTTTPYKLTSNYSSKETVLNRPADFSKAKGEVTRHLTLENYYHDYKVVIEQKTMLTMQDGEIFAGILNVPATLSKSDRPDIPSEYQLVRSFQFSTKDDSIVEFSMPVELSAPTRFTQDVDADRVALYWYDDSSEAYTLIGGELSEDQKTLTAQVNMTGKYAVLYSNKSITSDRPLELKDQNQSVMFKDIQGHWGQKFIEALTRFGLVENQSNFRPNDAITRAEVIKMIIEAMEKTERGNELLDEIKMKNYSYAQFTDVGLNDWFAPYVLVAYEEGVISGYEDRTFRAGNLTTRAEFVKLIVQALGEEERGEEQYEEFQERFYSYATFKDVSMQAWYAPYFLAAKDLGIVKGYEDMSFRGGNNITRAEASKMIAVAFGLEK